MGRLGDFTSWRASKKNWMSISSTRLLRHGSACRERVEYSILSIYSGYYKLYLKCPGSSGLGPFNPTTTLCQLHWPGRNRNGTVYTLWSLYQFLTHFWFLMRSYFTFSGWKNCCAVGGEDPLNLLLFTYSCSGHHAVWNFHSFCICVFSKLVVCSCVLTFLIFCILIGWSYHFLSFLAWLTLQGRGETAIQ